MESGPEGSWTKRDGVGQVSWLRTGPRKRMTLVEEGAVGVWGEEQRLGWSPRLEVIMSKGRVHGGTCPDHLFWRCKDLHLRYC